MYVFFLNLFFFPSKTRENIRAPLDIPRKGRCLQHLTSRLALRGFTINNGKTKGGEYRHQVVSQSIPSKFTLFECTM